MSIYLESHKNSVCCYLYYLFKFHEIIQGKHNIMYFDNKYIYMFRPGACKQCSITVKLELY